MRTAKIERKTKETNISVSIDLDGKGTYAINTTIPFLDHMLSLMSKHGLIDMKIQAKGDIEIDYHHTVEDLGIVLGKAVKQALRDMKGISRYGQASVPMDESLASVSLDISGRPYLVYRVEFPKRGKLRNFDPDLIEDFLQAFVSNSGITLHVSTQYGRNTHHIIEAVFKALGRALRQAVTIDPRVKGIPSTKKRIEETYGGTCVDTGSTAEMAPWMANGECEYRQGMHLWQDIVYAELVDPVTKRRVPYGKEGITVYTHLERTSQPMIRFWAGDISMWVNGPCPCGRTYPRLPKGIYGREDDMFIVRGENVYPSAVEDVIRGIKGFGIEYRIIITREGDMDELIVQVEYAKDAVPTVVPQLKKKLEEELRVRGLRTIVQMVEPNALERTEFKATRVIDKRNLHDRFTK